MRSKSRQTIWTQLKGKATDRKGMGMELALLVLFVVFACSTLLVSSALIGKSNLNDREDEMVMRLTLDQLAESALAGTLNGLESMEEAEKEAFLKQYADYAVFTYSGSVWSADLLHGTGIETSAFAEVVEADTDLLITDLSGTPLLSVAWETGVGETSSKITRWTYH